ncbi:hypothetical protein L6164_002325 [Bauhinia variegata]|uniref:Uncharacterized protein n=1 Tax=Bauhinia variegata TaxID=167791 RepID=A0ACB9PXA8_BAUVA|nr:hypothetical protein L6164_002325 [Bauhinia variegata]
MVHQENPKSGCFSGFIRVILCAGSEKSPPVHPSYHIAEAKETEFLHCDKEAREAEAVNPGVVARLMGLDSLPNSNWVSKGANPDSVPRSKSVNFMDYLLDFDLNQANNHRRVKTSASFREVPTLFEQKKHDFVVLYWDNVNKEHEFGSAPRNSEMGFGESKQKKKLGSGSKSTEVMREKGYVKKEKNQGKNKKISKLKNEPRRVPSSKHDSKIGNPNGAKARDLGSVSPRSKSSSSNSPLLNREKELTNRARNQESPKKIETEFCPENLSPVSVLDANDSPIINDITFSDYEIRSPLGSKSKWKSSKEATFSSNGIDESGSKNKAYYKSFEEAEYYTELMLKLCRLTEEDIRKSDLKTMTMFDSGTLREICVDFEHKILDLLLHETIHELVE